MALNILLPLEIVYMILGHLDQSDLARYARVSKYAQLTAIPILYRHVATTSNQGRRSFRRAIEQYPARARSVRTMHERFCPAEELGVCVDIELPSSSKEQKLEAPELLPDLRTLHLEYPTCEEKLRVATDHGIDRYDPFGQPGIPSVEAVPSLKTLVLENIDRVLHKASREGAAGPLPSSRRHLLQKLVLCNCIVAQDGLAGLWEERAAEEVVFFMLGSSLGLGAEALRHNSLGETIDALRPTRDTLKRLVLLPMCWPPFIPSHSTDGLADFPHLVSLEMSYSELHQAMGNLAGHSIGRFFLLAIESDRKRLDAIADRVLPRLLPRSLQTLTLYITKSHSLCVRYNGTLNLLESILTWRNEHLPDLRSVAIWWWDPRAEEQGSSDVKVLSSSSSPATISAAAAAAAAVATDDDDCEPRQPRAIIRVAKKAGVDFREMAFSKRTIGGLDVYAHGYWPTDRLRYQSNPLRWADETP